MDRATIRGMDWRRHLIEVVLVLLDLKASRIAFITRSLSRIMVQSQWSEGHSV